MCRAILHNLIDSEGDAGNGRSGYDESNWRPEYATTMTKVMIWDTTEHSWIIDVGKDLPALTVEVNIPLSPPSSSTVGLVATVYPEPKVPLAFIDFWYGASMATG